MKNNVYEKFGKIDVLINNAGVFPKFKKLHNISEKEWNEVIDVNLNGSFRFTKAVIPHMMKSGGSIINMSSDAGIRSFENFLYIHARKHSSLILRNVYCFLNNEYLQFQSTSFHPLEHIYSFVQHRMA